MMLSEQDVLEDPLWKEHLIHVSGEDILENGHEAKTTSFNQKVEIYTNQLLNGCGTLNCTTPTCASAEISKRKYTLLSARIFAAHLASMSISHVCPNLVLRRLSVCSSAGKHRNNLAQEIFHSPFVKTTLFSNSPTGQSNDTDKSVAVFDLRKRLKNRKSGHTQTANSPETEICLSFLSEDIGRKLLLAPPNIIARTIYFVCSTPTSLSKSTEARGILFFLSHITYNELITEALIKGILLAAEDDTLSPIEIALCIFCGFEVLSYSQRTESKALHLLTTLARVISRVPKEVLVELKSRIDKELAKDCMEWIVYALENYHTQKQRDFYLELLLRLLTLFCWYRSNLSSLRSSVLERRILHENSESEFIWLRSAAPHLLDHPYLFSLKGRLSYFYAACYQTMVGEYEDRLSAVGLSAQMSGASALMHFTEGWRSGVNGNISEFTNPYLLFEVRRDHILEDGLDWLRVTRDCDLAKPLRVRIVNGGEDGVDQGGVQKEFLATCMRSILDPKFGLWTIDKLTRISHIQPRSGQLQLFEYTGSLVGLALYNGIVIPVALPTFLYRHLLGLKIDLGCISDDMPDLYHGLTQLESLAEDNLQTLSQTFEFTFEVYGDYQTTEMCEDGSNVQVTMQNRTHYIDTYLKWVTEKAILPELEAFKRGFHKLVSGKILRLFSDKELRTVIEGDDTLDIFALQSITQYDDGYSVYARVIRDFWSVVHALPPRLQKALLEFVTASDRIPAGGYSSIVFVIQRNGPDSNYLPCAQTCFGRLLLPEYRSKRKVKEMLLMALQHTTGFGLA